MYGAGEIVYCLPVKSQSLIGPVSQNWNLHKCFQNGVAFFSPCTVFPLLVVAFLLYFLKALALLAVFSSFRWSKLEGEEFPCPSQDKAQAKPFVLWGGPLCFTVVNFLPFPGPWGDLSWLFIVRTWWGFWSMKVWRVPYNCGAQGLLNFMLVRTQPLRVCENHHLSVPTSSWLQQLLPQMSWSHWPLQRGSSPWNIICLMGLRDIDMQFVLLFLVAKVGTIALNLFFMLELKLEVPQVFLLKHKPDLVPTQNPDMTPHFTQSKSQIPYTGPLTSTSWVPITALTSSPLLMFNPASLPFLHHAKHALLWGPLL